MDRWLVEGLTASYISRKFGRDLEFLADEAGYELLILAGYEPVAVLDAAKLLMSYIGNRADDRYFATHPDMEDRVARIQRFAAAEVQKRKYAEQAVQQVEMNSHLRLSAQEMLRLRQFPELRRFVDDWLKAMPESGPAWLFHAKLLQRTQGTSDTVLDALERAVTFDPDSSEGWEALCTALFRRGYKTESAHCSRFIKDQEFADLYRSRTFGDALQVGGQASLAASTLWLGRTSSGGKLITTDPGLLKDRPEQKMAMPPQWKRMQW
jgi:predicted Zn-dependent protease